MAKRKGRAGSWTARVLLAAATLVMTAVACLVMDGRMRTLPNLPQREVEIVELLRTREGGPIPPRADDKPLLRTREGTLVRWKASLAELGDRCNRGLPFRLPVYDRHGTLYYDRGPGFYRVWVLCAFAFFLVALIFLFWPTQGQARVDRLQTVDAGGRGTAGVAVKGAPLTFDLPPPARKRRLICQVATQLLFAAAFVGWLTHAWGWSWWDLLLVIPIAATALLACWQDLLVRCLGVALLAAVPFLGDAFVHHLRWREMTWVEAAPCYVQYHLKQLGSGRHATREVPSYDVLFRYDWEGKTRYGAINLDTETGSAAIRDLRQGRFRILRNHAPEGDFSVVETGSFARILFSGLAALFCLIVGTGMTLLGTKPLRGNPDGF